MDCSTHLYLIRHGEAIPNVRPIMGGMRGDAGLTPLGISQVERLRDRLAATGEITADVLLTSPLPRARHTAEIIASVLHLPVQVDDDVQEIHVGEADGLHPDQVRERYGWDHTTDAYGRIAPGGESKGEFLVRVGTALTRIVREQAGKTVVVVCHGGVIDGSLLCFLGLSTLLPPPAQLVTHPTSITWWEHHDAAGTTQPWHLHSYNDALHLRTFRGAPLNWRILAGASDAAHDQSWVPQTTDDAPEAPF